MTKLNPIEAVITPLKTDAITRAEQEAKRIVENIRIELKTAAWDSNVVAPSALGTYGLETMVRLTKQNLVNSITEWDHVKWPGARSLHTPNIVKMSPKKIKKFIDTAQKDAAQQYDAFVAKLIEKIGPVKDAKLEGNHVWSFSILTVTLPNNETQRWKTQMIINVSKLGKFFHQWPTRRMK